MWVKFEFSFVLSIIFESFYSFWYEAFLVFCNHNEKQFLIMFSFDEMGSNPIFRSSSSLLCSHVQVVDQFFLFQLLWTKILSNLLENREKMILLRFQGLGFQVPDPWESSCGPKLGIHAPEKGGK